MLTTFCTHALKWPIAADADIPVIEDNAQGLGVPGLGRFGILAAQSFHDVKNVHCGEGGALLINDLQLVEGAKIMSEKRTNRSEFLRGQIDKYRWVAWGSSYLPSKLNAAALDSRLTELEQIQRRRFAVGKSHSSELADLADQQVVSMMHPPGGLHAAHLFDLLMPDCDLQSAFIPRLRTVGIIAAFHYAPLDTPWQARDTAEPCTSWTALRTSHGGRCGFRSGPASLRILKAECSKLPSRTGWPANVVRVPPQLKDSFR